MRKYILAALAAGSFATPALAQDVQPLGGFRLEGLVGYETTDVEDENSDGLTYGVGVGYDVQAGSSVFGIEAEAAKSGLDECVGGVEIAGDQLCVEGGRDLYVGGRFGAAIGGNSLLYAKAGYTNARFRAEYRATPTGTLVTTSDDLDGVRVGGGVQFGLGPNMYAKAEYRYSNYQDGFDKHQAVGGLGFRF